MKIRQLFQSLSPNERVVASFLFAWTLLNTAFLLLAGPFMSDSFINEKFWPFEKHSEFNDYDIIEFLTFVLIPWATLAGYKYLGEVAEKGDQAENGDLTTEKLPADKDEPSTYELPKEGIYILVAISILFVIMIFLVK